MFEGTVGWSENAGNGHDLTPAAHFRTTLIANPSGKYNLTFSFHANRFNILFRRQVTQIISLLKVPLFCSAKRNVGYYFSIEMFGKLFSELLPLTPWLMESGGSMQNSQGLSNNPYP